MSFAEAKWVVDEVVKKIGIPPPPMRMFKAVALSATSVGLKFLEPKNVPVYPDSEVAFIRTKGVQIRMATSDYPEVDEGKLILDNTQLGKYENDYFVIENLTQGTKYYFSAFPYADTGAMCTVLDKDNIVSCVVSETEINLDISISISDTSEFEKVQLILKDITKGTEQQKDVTSAGTYQFKAYPSHEVQLLVEGQVDYVSSIRDTGVFIAGDKEESGIDISMRKGFIYTVKVSYSRPEGELVREYTYLDDCSGYTPAQGASLNSWENSLLLKKIKPCLVPFGEATPAEYLNKNDFSKTIDGSESRLYDDDCDAMVEFEELWYKCYAQDDVTAIFTVSETPRTGFASLTAGAPKVYVGIYEGVVTSSGLHSLSNKKLTTTLIPTLQSEARKGDIANVKYCTCNDYYIVRMLQFLFLMMYRDYDAQNALGEGYTAMTAEDREKENFLRTGSMDSKSFCWGETTGKQGIKFLGIENIFGNFAKWVEGFNIRAEKRTGWTNRRLIGYLEQDCTKYNFNSTGYTCVWDGEEEPPASGGEWVSAPFCHNLLMAMYPGLDSEGFDYAPISGVSEQTSDTDYAMTFGHNCDSGKACGIFGWATQNPTTTKCLTRLCFKIKK